MFNSLQETWPASFANRYVNYPSSVCAFVSLPVFHAIIIYTTLNHGYFGWMRLRSWLWRNLVKLPFISCWWIFALCMFYCCLVDIQINIHSSSSTDKYWNKFYRSKMGVKCKILSSESQHTMTTIRQKVSFNPKLTWSIALTFGNVTGHNFRGFRQSSEHYAP